MNSIYNKNILLFLIPLFLSFTNPKGYYFKSEMMPNSNYKIITRIFTDSEVNYKGSDEVIARLKYSGIKIPMEVNGYRSFGESIKTDSLNSDSAFGIIMNVDYDSSLTIRNGDTLKVPRISIAGVQFAGIYTKNKLFKNIEVISGDLPEQLKSQIPEMIENMYKNIKYPDKPLAIGESFTSNIPMKIPVGSYPPINVNIVTHFNLNRVDRYKAYFNTIVEMSMKDSLKGVTIYLTGNGTGNLIHDLRKNFTLEYNSIMDMHEEISTDKLETLVKSKTKSYYQVVY